LTSLYHNVGISTYPICFPQWDFAAKIVTGQQREKKRAYFSTERTPSRFCAQSSPLDTITCPGELISFLSAFSPAQWYSVILHDAGPVFPVPTPGSKKLTAVRKVYYLSDKTARYTERTPLSATISF
jgi:hypothetical protein